MNKITITISGPRKCGKTTIAKAIMEMLEHLALHDLTVDIVEAVGPPPLPPPDNRPESGERIKC